MKKSKILKAVVILVAVTALLFHACAPVREFGRTPVYKGKNDFTYQIPAYDSFKKTVVVVANNDGTELFDMMAPFYLFNATEKANVYILAKNKFPIVIKKGFFVLPQLTFTQVDSLRIKPDVIVIPFLAVADSVNQDPVIVNWIRNHYAPDVTILSICDGAATAAATGLFDGKPITAHASDYEGIKAHFSKPLWVQNTSVASSGNLFSTAGVSNATEGSLTVINKLFGIETMQKVIENVSYPYQFPKLDHQSNRFHFGDKVAVGKKIIFRKNKKVGVLLQEGINEFELSGIMDTYNRTFPGSIESFSVGDFPVRSKYGLTLIPSGKIGNSKVDELHVVDPLSFPTSAQELFKSPVFVRYDNSQKQYIIDKCLLRIGAEYGEKYKNIVKLMLDYN
jgi:putative intracellular protease/amidase